MGLQTCFTASSDEGGIMASLINAHDWKNHPLGEIATWPRTLRDFVSTMLASRFPMYLAWGTDEYSFYNDSYIPFLADKHPGAIGATLECIWDELSPEIRAVIDKAKENKTSYFEDMLFMVLKNDRFEQRYFTFSYTGVRGDTVEVEGFYVVCIETIEAFHAYHQRVSESLSALFTQAPGFMAILRGPTHIIDITNEAFHSLVCKNCEIVGRTVLEILPKAQEEGIIGLLDQVYQTGQPFIAKEIRFVRVREPGEALTEMYLDFVYQPIFNEQKQVTGIMVQGQEVTETYVARQALLVADRQKDQFIATLAHELRNSIAPIRMAAHLIQVESTTRERLRQTIGIVSRQVEHMAKLLDDLLDVARISKNQVRLTVERISVDTIIATAIETAKPLIDKKSQEIVLLQHGLIQLNGDPVRLTQVITNLICNAAKYTDFGGEIIVSSRREGGNCVISIKDNGIGISLNALETIFDMFSQEKEEIQHSEGGLGIGLGLVKGLVSLHGGTVHAESQGKGKGSTFTVVLPCLARNDTVEVMGTPQHETLPATSLEILVVDDNVDQVNLLTSFLEMMGHKPLTATDGAQAFALAKLKRPDVAIVDIGMLGMNGYELAQAIRQQEWGREIALIAATGWGNAKDQDRTKSAGFDFHMTKPFALEKLQDTLIKIKKSQLITHISI